MATFTAEKPEQVTEQTALSYEDCRCFTIACGGDERRPDYCKISCGLTWAIAPWVAVCLTGAKAAKAAVRSSRARSTADPLLAADCAALRGYKHSRQEERPVLENSGLSSSCAIYRRRALEVPDPVAPHGSTGFKNPANLARGSV